MRSHGGIRFFTAPEPSLRCQGPVARAYALPGRYWFWSSCCLARNGRDLKSQRRSVTRTADDSSNRNRWAKPTRQGRPDDQPASPDVAGLYLNSYPLTCSGDVRVFEMVGIAAERTRREVRDIAGVPVWVERDSAFSYDNPGVPGAVKASRSLARPTGLSMFVMREAILAHCRSLDFDAWIGRAGELHVSGVTPPAREDRFQIEHTLQLRVGTEEYIDADAVLTARHRTRWRCTDSLSTPELAARASGSPAIRLRGDGPRRGQVTSIQGQTATLRVGAEAVDVVADDYTLTANAALVAGWRGSSVLRKLRVTAGELTISGKRNQHGVEDRFKLVGDAVRRLGGRIAVEEGGLIEIGRTPIQIRLEEP
jgi:hypothetical protein